MTIEEAIEATCRTFNIEPKQLWHIATRQKPRIVRAKECIVSWLPDEHPAHIAKALRTNRTTIIHMRNRIRKKLVNTDLDNLINRHWYMQ